MAAKGKGWNKETCQNLEERETVSKVTIILFMAQFFFL